jgi:hypothetical protein
MRAPEPATPHRGHARTAQRRLATSDPRRASPASVHRQNRRTDCSFHAIRHCVRLAPNSRSGGGWVFVALAPSESPHQMHTVFRRAGTRTSRLDPSSRRTSCRAHDERDDNRRDNTNRRDGAHAKDGIAARRDGSPVVMRSRQMLDQAKRQAGVAGPRCCCERRLSRKWLRKA